MASINGERLISCEIRVPRLGIWTADFEADVSVEGAIDAFAPDEEGRVRIRLEHAGATFVGTATRIGNQGARLSGRAVGGRDGLSKSIASKNYEVADVSAARFVSDLEDDRELIRVLDELDRIGARQGHHRRHAVGRAVRRGVEALGACELTVFLDPALALLGQREPCAGAAEARRARLRRAGVGRPDAGEIRG